MKFFSKSASDSHTTDAESNADSHANAKDSIAKDSIADSPAKVSIAVSPANDANSNHLYRKISNYAIICIAFLICVFNPYALYKTDITQFDSTQTYSTLSALFGVFILFSFIAIYALSFIPKKFSKIPAFILSLTLFVGLIYSIILVGDYGAMDHFMFQKTPFDDRDALIAKAREFIIAIAVGIIFVALALHKLLRIWQITFATLFIVSAINATNIILKRIDSADSTNFANPHSAPPQSPFQSELFSYSKTHKNIVIIVLDAFSGSHIKYLLEQFPHLRKQLDGFTHFPNTLTSGSATITSIAALIGGEHYTAYNMNARRANLVEEIDSAFIKTANAFANANFSVSLMAFVGSDNIKDITQKLNHQIFALDAGSRAFDEFYVGSENMLDKVANAESQSIQVALLLSFGLFRFTPELLILRLNLYNEGKWLLDKKRKKTHDATIAVSYAASFYALSRNVRADSTKATFKFIHSMMTHSPHGAHFDGAKCAFFDGKTAWDDYLHKVLLKYKDEQHYDAEACALRYLADYVELLKGAGIYDNTQIFVVSDHGSSDGFDTPETHSDALFLFKDFGAKGAIRTDNRFMANYDIASIFCENLQNGCPNVGQNILQNYPKNREIIHIVPISYLLKFHEPNRWRFNKIFKVRKNIYDAKNWEEVD